MKSKCEDCGNNTMEFPFVQCGQEPFGEQIAPIESCPKYVSQVASDMWMSVHDSQQFIIVGVTYSYPTKPSWRKVKPIALNTLLLRDFHTNEMPTKLTIAAGVYSECVQEYFKNIVPVDIV